MKSLGMVEPSQSEWCSPVVLVPKQDGSLRFCIDFRKINAISRFDPYLMPRIDELIERLGKAKFISICVKNTGKFLLFLLPEN